MDYSERDIQVLKGTDCLDAMVNYSELHLPPGSMLTSALAHDWDMMRKRAHPRLKEHPVALQLLQVFIEEKVPAEMSGSYEIVEVWIKDREFLNDLGALNKAAQRNINIRNS